MLGSGIIKGLVVTAKNFVGSYHDPARMVTVEYPEQPTRLPENYRNFPFLVYDGDQAIDGLRCVACKICEVECPPQCIYIVPDRDEKGRPTKRPRVFDLDVSVCMSCQICVEVCPFDAIKMDQHFEIAATDRFGGLLLRKEDLAKPNAHFHAIHPTEAAEVDAMLAEAKARAAAAAKAAPKPAPTPATGNGPASTRPATAQPPASEAAATSPRSDSQPAPAPGAGAPKPPPPTA